MKTGAWTAGALVVVVAVGAGCLNEHKPTPATSDAEVMGAAAAPVEAEEAAGIESYDSMLHVADSTGTDFKAVYGPYSDPTSTVSATLALPQTKLTVTSNGGDYYVYVSGHFSGTAPGVSEVYAPTGPVRLIWPIVYTERIKTGAEGTSFLVYVTPSTGKQTVVRLGESAGGTVEVRSIASTLSASIPTAELSDKAIRYVFDLATGGETMGSAAPPSVAEQAVIKEVIRRARLKGAPVPPRPDDP